MSYFSIEYSLWKVFRGSNYHAFLEREEGLRSALDVEEWEVSREDALVARSYTWKKDVSSSGCLCLVGHLGTVEDAMVEGGAL